MMTLSSPNYQNCFVLSFCPLFLSPLKIVFISVCKSCVLKVLKFYLRIYEFSFSNARVFILSGQKSWDEIDVKVQRTYFNPMSNIRTCKSNQYYNQNLFPESLISLKIYQFHLTQVTRNDFFLKDLDTISSRLLNALNEGSLVGGGTRRSFNQFSILTPHQLSGSPRCRLHNA